MDLRVLYRGPLESCNYGCDYCPFAKRTEDRAARERDRRALDRFVDRVASLGEHRFGLFFTPWGEALVRRSYREAMVSLSQLAHVERVAIQTNLSAPLAFVARADARKLAFWATYHPGWTPRARFVAKVRALCDAGARVSCGIVGFRRFGGEAEALRRELPEDVYLWVNAVKSTPRPEPYDAADVARFSALDPLFPVNLTNHPSAGRACRTGASVFTVDGDGTMRRCHFVRDAIGNFFEGRLADALRERPCPNATCGCHIGYVHLDHLGLSRVFEGGILERVPARRLALVT
jgi:hypothetical protein